MLGTQQGTIEGVYTTGRGWECMHRQVTLYNILGGMLVLRTAPRLDDAVHRRRPNGMSSPRCAARHEVDTTSTQRATRAPIEFKMSCAGDTRRFATV